MSLAAHYSETSLETPLLQETTCLERPFMLEGNTLQYVVNPINFLR